MKELIEEIANRFMSEDENLSWEEAWQKAEEYVSTGQHVEFHGYDDIFFKNC